MASKKTEILIVASYFPPELGPNSYRMANLTSYLANKGVSVKVLTCNPRYPRGFAYERLTASTGTYTTHGAEVIVFNVPQAKTDPISRFAEELFFYTRGLKVGMKLTTPDAVIGTSPFFSAACLGYRLATFFGRPFIYDIQDLYPDNLKLAKLPVPGVLYNYFNGWANRMYKQSSAVVLTQQSLLITLKDKLHSKRHALIMNPVEPKGLDYERKPAHENEPVVVGYAGLWGRGYDFKTYLELVKSADKKRFTFRLIGDGVWRKVVKRFVAQAPTNFSVHFGWMERNQLITEYPNWQISIVPEKPEWTKTMWPAKIPELLTHGIVVIVPAELPLPAELHGLSLIVKPKQSSVEGYLEALEKARDIAINTSPQQFAEYRKRLIELFDPNKLGEKYYQIVQEVLNHAKAED